jgi:hypothetical protein
VSEECEACCGIFSGCKYFMGVLEADSGFVQHFLSQKIVIIFKNLPTFAKKNLLFTDRNILNTIFEYYEKTITSTFGILTLGSRCAGAECAYA